MPLPLDYRDLLRILNRYKVRYLIVGAYAVIYYTEPRYTKDMDIWIEPTKDNAKRLYDALKEFGAPLKNIKEEDFTNKNLIYQIGVEPVRVDIIMGLKGLDFKEAWRSKKIADFEGVKTNIIGIKDLIKSKKKSKRDFDRRDVEILRIKLRLKKG